MMSKMLIFVRHGESEGNVGSKMVRNGESNNLPPELTKTPGWKWRLTPKGVWQSKKAGEWLRENLPPITKGYVSWYIRALETAAGLELEGEIWRPQYYTREREYGDLDTLPSPNQLDEYAKFMEAKRNDRTFWTPPNGESQADLMLRMDRFFDTVHRGDKDDVTLSLQHGDSIAAGEMKLEQLAPWQYEKIANSDKPEDAIRNCQIIAYSRINPWTGEESEYLDWKLSICPWDPPATPIEQLWRPIERKKYTGAELLQFAEQYPHFFS